MTWQEGACFPAAAEQQTLTDPFASARVACKQPPAHHVCCDQANFILMVIRLATALISLEEGQTFMSTLSASTSWMLPGPILCALMSVAGTGMSVLRASAPCVAGEMYMSKGHHQQESEGYGTLYQLITPQPLQQVQTKYFACMLDSIPRFPACFPEDAKYLLAGRVLYWLDMLCAVQEREQLLQT